MPVCFFFFYSWIKNAPILVQRCTFIKKKTLYLKTILCIWVKANVSVPTEWRSAFICVKGCEGSNSRRPWKVANVGSAADWGEWATSSHFHSLCLCLFDQASPGPQELQLQHIQRRNKAAIISWISSTLCLQSLTPRQEDPALLCSAGIGGGGDGPWCEPVGSVKRTGDTLTVDKHRHNSVWHRSPRRWEKTEYGVSGDKEKKKSGIVGRCQLKTLKGSHFASQTL